MEINKILQGNSLDVLKTLPDNSIDCCVTSPPYYGLRDYGMDGQFGLEETPELYVEKMVSVFNEVKRVLKKEGTLWLNIGDSYASNTKGSGGPSAKQDSNSGSRYESRKFNHGVKEKDLIGIPWLIAFALRKDGWYLRQDIIWHKPNPMPESVTDRCTKSHEYIFLLSKSPKYYYDYESIKTVIQDASVQRLMQDVESQKGSDRVPGKMNGSMKAVGNLRKGYEHRGTGDEKLTKHSGNFDENGDVIGGGLANKRSVWTVTTQPYSEAHFATFPPDLIVDCIKAGCPEFLCEKCGIARSKIIKEEAIKRVRPNKYTSYRDVNGQPDQTKAGSFTTIIGYTDCKCEERFVPGIVLDPFMGAGTTAMVARKLNRNYIGCELNPKYIKIAERRLHHEIGLFNT